uniref:Lachesin n=1 Tax=Panagrellus redivivus TaxID=6233 RepID=A0A7E4UR07_PANRE
MISLYLVILTTITSSVCVRNPPPVFASEIMHNVTAVKGDDVEFRCRVTDRGRHMVAFIREEVPPKLIAFDDRVFKQREKYEVIPRPSHDEWILKIKNVAESDIGGYICQLNSNPVMTRTAYLNLKIPPTVSRSSTPAAVEVREGHNVTLTCHAKGNPAPTVIWRRADRQIIRFNGATGFGSSVHNGSKLHLTKVSRKHMSEYVCVASNGIPPDESWTVKLHVTFEPIVIPQASVVEAHQGKLVRLVCNVEAWPRPLVTWYHEDVELFDSNKYSTEQAVTEKYKSVHILEIKKLKADEFGTYKCVAGNDYGKHYAEIKLVELPWHDSNSVVLTEGSATDVDIEFEDDPTTTLPSNLFNNAIGTKRRSHDGTKVITHPVYNDQQVASWPELRQVSSSPFRGPSIILACAYAFQSVILSVILYSF